MQKYIGEGSRIVREFMIAREHAPSIIFIDENDSIGSSTGESGSGSEGQRTMLELLNELDGFEPTKNIKVIMATNRIGRPFFSFFSRMPRSLLDYWICAIRYLGSCTSTTRSH